MPFTESRKARARARVAFHGYRGAAILERVTEQQLRDELDPQPAPAPAPAPAAPAPAPTPAPATPARAPAVFNPRVPEHARELYARIAQDRPRAADLPALTRHPAPHLASLLHELGRRGLIRTVDGRLEIT